MLSHKRSPLINLGEKIFFQPAYVPNGVLQGSNLGHLLFLICISDMTQDIKYILFMMMIRAWLDNRKMWMKSKSKWMKILKIFVIDSHDDKLSIHFGRDKTKSIRSATKFEIFKGRKNVIMGI